MRRRRPPLDVAAALPLQLDVPRPERALVDGRIVLLDRGEGHLQGRLGTPASGVDREVVDGPIREIDPDRVVIDRSSASLFEDKTIPLGEVEGVDYSGGFVTGHIQIHQAGVEAGSGGPFSHPVDENTLYFARGLRPCAERARDAILERAGEG